MGSLLDWRVEVKCGRGWDGAGGLGLSAVYSEVRDVGRGREVIRWMGCMGDVVYHNQFEKRLSEHIANNSKSFYYYFKSKQI